VSGGALGVTAASPADLSGVLGAPGAVRMPLSAADGVLIAEVELATFWGTLPLNTLVGLFAYNRRSNNALWFGVKNVGGTLELGYQVRVNNVLSAFTSIVNASNTPYWLQLISQNETPNSGLYNVAYSTTGPSSGFTTVACSPIGGCPTDIEWVGVAALSAGAIASSLSASFESFSVRCLNGLRPFCWYAYRNMSLPGTPDMIGGNLTVQRIKPAHTFAAAIGSMSVLCDDPLYGLPDRGPMGGF
jgi:hypothetical protein